MFPNAEFEARKERFNDIVRDSQQYQYAHIAQKGQTQERQSQRAFLLNLWRRLSLHTRRVHIRQASHEVESPAARASRRPA